MYTVFTSKKRILFSYKARSVRSCGYEENGFTPEEKSIEDIHRMIAEGFAFFPINKGTSEGDIRNYIEMGFKVAFLRAGEFRKLKKDYKDFI